MGYGGGQEAQDGQDMSPCLWWCPVTHISLFPAGLLCAQHGDVKRQGSQGLGLDHNGAGLRPPNGALIWGSGWGSPSTLLHLEVPLSLPCQVRTALVPGARHEWPVGD